MSMQLVALDKDLVDKIVDIQKGVFLDGWSKQMLLDGLSANLCGIVAIDKEKTLGFITYSVSLDSSDLNDIFVVPEYRKQGIGEKLISAYFQSIISKGVVKSLLEVRKSNQTAINLYNKVGYKQISKREKYYDDGETALVLLKELL